MNLNKKNILRGREIDTVHEKENKRLGREIEFKKHHAPHSHAR